MSSSDRLRVVVLLWLCCFLSESALAQSPGKSGVSPSVISLPSGPGAIEGLGPSFEPQLNTGTASYGVTIAIPPGVAGHTPEIALSYNSGNGNGYLGIGWTIEIPAIKRQLDKGLPKYTAASAPAATEDTFVYEGEELVPLSDGSYRCENESEFIRFRKIASVPSGPVNAWEGTMPDGRKMTFGASPGERVTRKGGDSASFADTYCWQVSTFSDTSGNVIRYEYTTFAPESVGVLYPSRIEYARFAENIHHRVEFTYSGSARFPEARTDILSDYRAGFEVRTSRLLREISVLTDGRLVRRYELGYEPDPTLTPPDAGEVKLGFRLLQKVTQLDNTGSDANYLPPLRFAYSRFEKGAAAQPAFRAVVGGFNFLRFGPTLTETIDINSDGLPDFISSSSDSWYAYLNQGNAKFSDEIPFTTSATAGTDQANGKRLDEPALTLADLDGDGITDLFQKAAASQRILMHRNLNDFDAPSTLDSQEVVRWGPEKEFNSEIQIGEFGAMDIADPSIRMLDLNFDKRTDAMRPFDFGDGTGGIEYIFNLADGWQSELIFKPDPRLPLDWSPDEARFDRQNAAARTSGLADLNGDRLEDWFTLAVVGDETRIDYWPNANGGFWAARRSTAAIPTPDVRADELRLLDVNSDGLTDVVLVRHFQLTFWMNSGNDKWSDPIVRNDAPAYIDGRTVLRQFDVNANGTVDLFWDNSNLEVGTLPDEATRFAYFDFVGELKPNLLTVIDNGIGLRTLIYYKSSSEDYLAALKSGHPWITKMPFPVMVVSRTIEDVGLDLNADGKNDQYITDITYRDGYYDSFEKEFRGFAFVEEIERGDDYDPTTGETIVGTGIVSGPSLVTRHRYLTGTPDGADNDDYTVGYNGAKVTDEGTGTGGSIESFADDRGGREEETLKGVAVFEETIDAGILNAPPAENAGFHACARAVARAARADPADPRAFRCTPDKYVYNRSHTNWKVRRLYRPQGINNPPGRFNDGDDAISVYSLTDKSVSFSLSIAAGNEAIAANGFLREKLDGKPVGYPLRPSRVTRSETRHDDYGNLVFRAEYGIVEPVSAFDDERITKMTFILDAAAVARWQIRSPSKERVEDENGVFVSETRFYYDGEELVGLPFGQIGSRGLLKRTEKVITEDPSQLPALESYDPDRLTRTGDPRLAAGSFIVSSRMAHDIYGNAIVVMDPLGRPADVELLPDRSSPLNGRPKPGNNGHFRIIDYDQTRHSLPASERVVIGNSNEDLVMVVDYNPGFSVVTQAWDWNGNRTSFVYDSFGRLVKIVRPGDSLDKPTQRFLYRPADSQRNLVYQYSDSGDLTSGAPTQTASPVASAVESRFREDLSDSVEYNTFDTLRFTSGVGQELMTLSEDEPGRWVVSEAFNYNLRDGQFAAYLSYYRTNALYHSAGAQGVRHDGLAVASTDRIESFQDAVGRTIRTINPPETPGGTRSINLTQHLPFETRGFDPTDSDADNPNYDTPVNYLNDGLHRLLEVHESTRLEDDGAPGTNIIVWPTRYTHDLRGRLVKIEDSQNNVQWFRYDGLGRKLCKNDPDRGIRAYRYDNACNPVEVVDAKGQKTTFTYDGVNRILTEDYHDEGLPFSFNRRYDPSQPLSETNQPDVAYFYDAFIGSVDAGNGERVTPANLRGYLARVVDLAGETVSSFDARGRAAWEVRRIPDPLNGQPVSFQTRLKYDAMDRAFEITYPDEDRVRYEYNSRNLLDRIQGNGGSNVGTPYIVRRTRYTPSGDPDTFEFGNGLTTACRYDPRLRIKALTTTRPGSQPILAYQYSYDAAANLLRIDDLRDTSSPGSAQRLLNTQVMSYDDLHRLSSTTYPQEPMPQAGSSAAQIIYRYDRVGNLIHQSSNIAQQERGLNVANLGNMNYGNSSGRQNRIGRITADAGPHALTSTSSGHSYHYDKNGNIIQLNALVCEWDFRDRLVAVENDDARAEYTYDHQDRRTIRKVISKANAATQQASSESSTLYVSRYFEVRDHGQPVKYVWHGDRRIARITGSVDETAPRLQRWRAWAGWNLLASAVTAADGIGRLGLGFDPNVRFIGRWQPLEGTYSSLGSSDGVAAGDVLWVYCTAAANLSLRGNYQAAAPISLAAGANSFGSAGLEFLQIPSASISSGASLWFYDAAQREWTITDATTFSPRAGTWTLDSGAAAYIRTDSALQLASPEPSLQIQYYHGDPLDSVNLLTDGAGNVIEEAVFYPFGQTRRASSVANAKGILHGHYRFGQKEQDAESGLTYFEARYLAPILGRFNRVDPISEDWPTEALQNPQALNTYSYCNNNPFKYRDPDGHIGILAPTAANKTGAVRGSKSASKAGKGAASKRGSLAKTPAPKKTPEVRNPKAAAARLLSVINRMSIPEAKMVFWSGAETAEKVAVDIGKKANVSMNRLGAEKSDYTALGKTLIGNIIGNDPVMQDGAADWATVQKPIWEAVSEKLARSSTGYVEAWVVDSKEGSIWNRIEKPTLMENKNVKGIIYRSYKDPGFREVYHKP